MVMNIDKCAVPVLQGRLLNCCQRQGDDSREPDYDLMDPMLKFGILDEDPLPLDSKNQAKTKRGKKAGQVEEAQEAQADTEQIVKGKKDRKWLYISIDEASTHISQATKSRNFRFASLLPSPRLPSVKSQRTQCNINAISC